MTSAAHSPPSVVHSTGLIPCVRPNRETGHEEITRTGGVDDTVHRSGRDLLGATGGEDDGALGATRHDHQQAGLLGGLDRGIIAFRTQKTHYRSNSGRPR